MNTAEHETAFPGVRHPGPDHGELLARIDTYYDTAPRATARAEAHGSLVLFVAEQGSPFYARPNLARTTEPTAEEVKEVLARQLELGIPRALEWIHETAPSLATVARAAGMTVQECPMLVLESLVEPPSPDGAVRLMNAKDDDLAAVNASIRVAFGTAGTAVSDGGAAERDDATASTDASHGLGNTIDALRAGRTVMVGAFVNDVGAVGGGSHNPRGQVSEMVGVGVLPAFRRQGLGAAVAHLLSRHALDNGVTTVFCGADSSDVARVYEGVGFRRIGTTCIAGLS
ncbi:MAG: GNAT family N-acetyltransferase [Phycicoccus sp.]|nr:GNAT family N-acetyltransferase [Phycicoccus sp.]NMM34680.1 GNAT family N-acetyltransferase [Phycicoccus sp.]